MSRSTASSLDSAESLDEATNHKLLGGNGGDGGSISGSPKRIVERASSSRRPSSLAPSPARQLSVAPSLMREESVIVGEDELRNVSLAVSKNAAVAHAPAVSSSPSRMVEPNDSDSQSASNSTTTNRPVGRFKKIRLEFFCFSRSRMLRNLLLCLSFKNINI
jgi:hypothetical protein